MATPATIELDGQYRQLREECGVLDRSGRGMVIVRGAEGAEYLQGQLTNDIEALGPGRSCYAALLDRKGHMQADMRVQRMSAEEIWIDTEGSALPAVLRHLTMYSVGREIEITEVGEEYAILGLIGPRAAEIAPAAGADPRIAPTPLGLDLIVGAPEAGELAAALAKAGAPAVTEQAAEVVRIEAGIPRFGAEMTTETMPAEAGIVERAVSFTKGCYIGQETVARLHYKGKPNRHLRGLRFSAPAVGGAALRLGEKQVGTVGSACLSPALGPIGMAIVRREAEPGTELAAGESGITATVAELPFTDLPADADTIE